MKNTVVYPAKDLFRHHLSIALRQAPQLAVEPTDKDIGWQCNAAFDELLEFAQETPYLLRCGFYQQF